MDDVITLWDAPTQCRWCTHEDIDKLVGRLLSPEVNLPKNVLCCNVSLAKSEQGDRFTEGAVIHAIYTTQRTRNWKRLQEDKMWTHMIPYNEFIICLLVYVEVWFPEVPFLEDGQLNVDSIPIPALERIFRRLLDKGD